MVKFYAVEFIRNFGRIAYNGLGIGEEGAFENRQSNIRTNVDSCTIVQLLPSAPFLPIPC